MKVRQNQGTKTVKMMESATHAWMVMGNKRVVKSQTDDEIPAEINERDNREDEDTPQVKRW
jgi:hypothetical protein